MTCCCRKYIINNSRYTFPLYSLFLILSCFLSPLLPFPYSILILFPFTPFSLFYPASFPLYSLFHILSWLFSPLLPFPYSILLPLPFTPFSLFYPASISFLSPSCIHSLILVSLLFHQLYFFLLHLAHLTSYYYHFLFVPVYVHIPYSSYVVDSCNVTRITAQSIFFLI